MNRICAYCGNRLGDTSKFCMRCGKASVIVLSERERLLQVIEGLMGPMEHLFVVYFDREGAKQRLQREEKRIHYLHSQMKVFPWVVGLVATYLCVTVLSYIFSSFGLGLYTYNIVLCLFAAVGSFLLVSRIMKKLYLVSLKNSGKNREHFLEDYQSKNQAYLNAMGALDQEALEVIPPDYRSVGALRFFYTALRNQRVQNMQQAVNLYEMENHQARMEKGQALQTQYIKSIEHNAAKTAVATEFLVLDRILHS